jgi:steroid 5-alpha reductase family enzyme
MLDALLIFLLATLGINVAMFIPAYLFKTDKFTDISYALSFLAIAIVAFLYSESWLADWLLLVAISLWAIRLGGFLLFRIWRYKKDRRFDGMREDFIKFLKFWLLQGLSVWVVMLPALLAWPAAEADLAASSIIGLSIFALGLGIEAVADWQKYRFNSKPTNKARWIDSGLWRYSRHPNYLGEMMVWVGLYIYCLPFLNGWLKLVGLASPIYIIGLLLFVSGVPLLEKAADVRWGKDPKYQEYKRRTAVIVPGLKT